MSDKMKLAFRAYLLGGVASTLMLAGGMASAAAQAGPQPSPQQAGEQSAEAQVPQGASPASEDAATDAGEIVVTGSRIATTALTAPTPIAQVGSEDLLLSGSATVENLLNTLPQVTPGESGFTNNEASGAATIDLRGLGPQRNLILVNGRRYIFFDARQITDLNTIPTGLVERVELITGGSSAVYGSDAVSGVVNFVLRDDFEGIEITPQYDVTKEGDATKLNVDLIGGKNFADGRGNVTAYFNYFDREAALADARKRSECFLEDTVVNGVPSLVCGGSAGIPNGRIAGLPVGAALAARPSVQQALTDLGLGSIDGLGFKFDETGRSVSPFVAPGDRYNFNPLNYLQLPQERIIGGLNAKFEVSEGFEPYFEGIYTNNKVETKRAPIPVGGNVLVQTNSPFLTPQLQTLFRALDATEGSLVLDANNQPVIGANGRPTVRPAPTANDGYTSVSIGRRLNEVGTRDVEFNRDAIRAVGGARGALGDAGENFLTNLKYDAYYSFARTKNETTSVGNISEARFRQGVTTASGPNGSVVCRDPSNGCVPINIFGANLSAEAIDWIKLSQVSKEEAEMQVATGAITGDLLQMPAGAVGFAAGAEWRKVSALFIPAVGGVGDVGQRTEGDYNVWELFGEVRVPVISSLELTGAFRYSDYSLDNVGGVWTYGAGATFRPFDGLMLRGQYQRAVRAPSIQELFGARSTVTEAATDPCATPTAATNATIRNLCIGSGVPPALAGSGSVQPNFQITGIVGGNPDLEEETTDTYSVGAVLRPSFLPRLSVTVDYYNITVEDAIARLGGSINGALNICYNVVQDIDSPFCQSVQRTPEGVIQSPGGVSVLNANIGKLKTDGVDINLFYTAPLGIWLGEEAKLSVSSGINWLNAFERTPVAVLPGVVDRCTGAFGLTCGEPLPEWKATTRTTLDIGPASLSLRWRYIGSVTDDQVTSGRRAAATLAVPEIGAEHYFDLSGSFKVGERFTLFGGVINLTNNKQTLIGNSQEQLNTFPSTYDPLGTRFFIGATARF